MLYDPPPRILEIKAKTNNWISKGTPSSSMLGKEQRKCWWARPGSTIYLFQLPLAESSWLLQMEWSLAKSTQMCTQEWRKMGLENSWPDSAATAKNSENICLPGTSWARHFTNVISVNSHDSLWDKLVLLTDADLRDVKRNQMTCPWLSSDQA